ncbi:MAG TPA: GTPase [Gemmataceae bacterium]|nr:GTPase [Gemmataceae bacterium]
MKSTTCACLTPAGNAALATLAVRGPAAWTIVRKLAQRDLPLDPQPGRFWLTRFGAGNTADEVVVAVNQTNPEAWLELHCHGGREVLRLFEELLGAQGVEILTWQDFDHATTADHYQTAALPVLTNALTARTAAIALDQYQGAFSRAVKAICEAFQSGDTATAIKMLANLNCFGNLGHHLTTPWKLVIAGAPNVGKSTLVNALAGYERSIVSPIPGTTRDVVTTLLAIDGWPVEISDTAGWRSTQSSLECEGIDRAQKAIANADVCLWILDGSTAPIMPGANLGPVHLVINKCDLAAAWPAASVDALAVSAHTSAGLPELCQAIATWLVPRAPPPGAAVPFSPALADAIAEIASLTKSGRTTEALGKLENLCRECD